MSPGPAAWQCTFLMAAVAPALATGPTAGRAATTVLVMPVEAGEGVSSDLAEQVTALLTAEAARLPGLRVTAYREVAGAMTQETARQLAGCDAVSCAAEIAGALNTQEVLVGSLTRVAEMYVLAMSRVRARDAYVISRAAERLPAADDGALLKRLPVTLRTLYPDESAALASAGARPLSPWRNIARATGGAGLVAAVAGTLLSVAMGAVVMGVVGYDFVRGDWSRRHHAVPYPVGVASNVLSVVAVLGLGTAVFVALGAGALVGTSFVAP